MFVWLFEGKSWVFDNVTQRPEIGHDQIIVGISKWHFDSNIEVSQGIRRTSETGSGEFSFYAPSHGIMNEIAILIRTEICGIQVSLVRR